MQYLAGRFADYVTGKCENCPAWPELTRATASSAEARAMLCTSCAIDGTFISVCPKVQQGRNAVGASERAELQTVLDHLRTSGKMMDVDLQCYCSNGDVRVIRARLDTASNVNTV